MSRDSGHEDEIAGKAYDAELARRLLGYLRPYRRRVVLAVLLLIGGAALEMIGPLLTKYALDRAIPNADFDLLWLLVGAYLASLLIGFGLEYGQVVLTTWLGQRVMYDLRKQIFGHLQNLSLRYFDRNPVGRLMTRITNDVEVLNELFSSGVVSVFGDVFTLVFIVGIMLYLEWRLALVAFVAIPVVVVVAFLFRKLVRKAFREIRVRLARINAFIQERISGIAVVHLFGREPHDNARFERINRDHLDSHLRAITYYAAFFPVIEVLTASTLALILWYGGGRILDDTLTVGTMAAFFLWARRFFRPIQDLSEKYNMLQGAMAASERIFDLLDTEPEIRDEPRPQHLPTPGRGEIEFVDVWFRYSGGTAEGDGSDGRDPVSGGTGAAEAAISPAVTRADNGQWDAEREEWVLKGLSFRIDPGKRVAIVGATGAGKSTIINLLMRFYEPQRGEIRFDGVPIQHVPVAELRERIGLVLQDVFLFSEDVRYNIRLGSPNIEDEQVFAAARRVGADRMIERLPRGYAQPLGERGTSLSVGERQLVSFARALAFDPLVLVLDEATSSVDAELEAHIDAALDELMAGRTSVVIAHRLSTVLHADQILVLHHGELRERGTHAELLRAGGLYSRLHELQFVSEPASEP